tara:strand:+ start:324 stop:575 length:252 start_codon:yes stop_codon:yes gene_type:complete
MINNNVINFESFTKVKKVKRNNNTLKEYKVNLFENRQYEFVVSSKDGEEAEEYISTQYKDMKLDLSKPVVFTFETLAELVNDD